MSLRISFFTTILGIVALASVWHTGVLARKPDPRSSVHDVSHGMANSQTSRSQSSALHSVVNLPLAFEANTGQAAADVKFIARAGGSNLLLTAQSIQVESDESVGIKFAGAD